jgi:hypothetical protein
MLTSATTTPRPSRVTVPATPIAQFDRLPEDITRVVSRRRAKDEVLALDHAQRHRLHLQRLHGLDEDALIHIVHAQEAFMAAAPSASAVMTRA